MQRQRAHQHCVTNLGYADFVAAFGYDFRYLTDRNYAARMATGGNPQGAVGVATLVEVKSDREETGEHLQGRAGIVDSIFGIVRNEPGGSDPPAERKLKILMPGNLPVRCGCLVEGDSLYRRTPRREHASAFQFSANHVCGSGDLWSVE